VKKLRPAGRGFRELRTPDKHDLAPTVSVMAPQLVIALSVVTGVLEGGAWANAITFLDSRGRGGVK